MATTRFFTAPRKRRHRQPRAAGLPTL